ncbi:hypothetical protein GCM10023238_33500 [Streptomyces heliomycini]
MPSELPHPPGAAGRVREGGADAAALQELLIYRGGLRDLVVLRTHPPGAAQFLASAIDQADCTTSRTIASATTRCLLISREPTGGQALADHLLRLAQNGQ